MGLFSSIGSIAGAVEWLSRLSTSIIERFLPSRTEKLARESEQGKQFEEGLSDVERSRRADKRRRDPGESDRLRDKYHKT